MIPSKLCFMRGIFVSGLIIKKPKTHKDPKKPNSVLIKSIIIQIRRDLKKLFISVPVVY